MITLPEAAALGGSSPRRQNQVRFTGCALRRVPDGSGHIRPCKKRRRQKQEGPHRCGPSDMADSGGFEPPTARFVAEYSIQLSYESAGGVMNESTPVQRQSDRSCHTMQMAGPGGFQHPTARFVATCSIQLSYESVWCLMDQITAGLTLSDRTCHPTNMADSGGFEPPTARFVAEYSIQLSYESAGGAGWASSPLA